MELTIANFTIQESPSFELEGIYKDIEKAGRTCYKSEDKITDSSAKAFVDRLICSGHGAMLEHGTVYLDFTSDWISARERYSNNKYSKVYKNSLENGWDIPHIYVTTNFRVIVENNWFSDLKYICTPTKYHEKRISVKFVCDRGVSHEFVRHRTHSFAQESTRYCNYLKDKFGGSVTCIIPPWLKEEETLEFEEDLHVIEQIYFKWLGKGWTAQQARGFLSHFTKTELVMTGFISDWKHFFELRDAASAHPQAQELAHPLHELFIQKGLIK